MLKKICAIVCLLAILLSVAVGINLSADAAETAETVTDYQVGFARVDINPYVEDGNFDSGIMALPLYGSGDVWNRLSTYGMVDDNGDGKINTEDGLKATCIAVTDYKGNTVLLITVDMIGALQSTRIRNAVMERVEAAIAGGEVKNVVMDISRIYYTGTHTHNAPQADAYSASGMTGTNNDGVDLSVVNQNLGIWIDRTVEDVADAAILALKDRAAATVTKDSVSASACTDTAVKGKVMNSVRHYVAEDKGCVAGDNFNNRGSNPKQVTQVNDVMHLLQFDFSAHNAATGDSKLPIVIANWRAHPSLNNSSGTYKQSSANCISSDFVNAFRRTLETKATISAQGKVLSSGAVSYRVAFFQAAGGNVNPRGYEKTNGTAAYSWIDTYAKNQGTSRGNVYGRVLGAMAKNGLTTSAGRETVAAGEIRTLRYYKNGIRNSTGVSALAYEAAKYYQENVGTGTYVYTSSNSGEVYVIGSKFHANSLISKWNVTMQTPANTNASMEINTVMVGEDLAFVTGSGELFDYYYKENGVYTAENNAWNDLINTSTYGTPFVLELCNAMNGYVPNYYAYDYNLGSTTWARGSYEAHTTSYPQGTGEEMIGTMKRMLNTLAESADGSREAYCQHCGVSATWLPYDGKTAMASEGHYYLPEDNHTPQIHVKDGKTLCFDLNGHTLLGDSRVFYTVSGGNATLNLMDTSEAQSGVVKGCSAATGAAAGFGGGTIVVDKGNTFNLYSGTLDFYQKGVNTVNTGGIVYVSGTFNMYGGTVRGSYADSFTGQYLSGSSVVNGSRTGYSAAIHVTGTFNMCGGSVESGKLRLVTGSISKDVFGNNTYMQTITDREGDDPCVRIGKNAVVTLAGSANIENLFLAGGTASKLTVKGDYTGTVELGYPEGTTLEQLQTIAAVEALDGVSADVSGATITFRGVEDLTAAVKDGQLVVSESSNSYNFCQYCKDTVQWTPLTNAELDKTENTKGMKPGHYVLKESVTTIQKQLNPDGTNSGSFCFDLNGYEFHGTTRAFYVYNNTVLNLQDSRGGGLVQGDRGANNYAGSVYCYGSDAVLNVYGAKVVGTPVTNLRGSAICVVNGTVNLFDAEVSGNHSKEYGGTISCMYYGKLNVYGGVVKAGKTDGKGECIYVDTNAKVSISGGAAVDAIYLNGDPASAVTVDTTGEAFTGTTVLTFATQINEGGVDVGDVTGTYGLQNASITLASGLGVVKKGADLVTAEPAAYLCADGAVITAYLQLQDALSGYAGEEGQYVRLNETVTENITVSRDVYMDLNGYDITGAVTVAEGATLYCMDSQTDDYAAFDANGIGHITGKVEGNVEAVPANTLSARESETNAYRAGYVKVTRSEGLSFHRVYLKMDSMSLRPSAVGVYYRCDFQADEYLSEEIVSFGIALSVFGAPTEETLNTQCDYSRFYDFANREQTGTGTLLQNIMRAKNTDAINAGNAATVIFGRTYIETSDGYFFGDTVAWSLQDLVEGIDAAWTQLTDIQKQGVLDMYETYKSVMMGWNIPNIKSAAAEA